MVNNHQLSEKSLYQGQKQGAGEKELKRDNTRNKRICHQIGWYTSEISATWDTEAGGEFNVSQGNIDACPEKKKEKMSRQQKCVYINQ
jgi:hypothetical protein